MSVQEDLAGLSPDDLLFNVAIRYNGTPLDLSTVTGVTAWLKPSAISPDAQAKTYTIGTGLTVTDSAGGLLTWFIPHTDLPGNSWYRVTVTDTASHPSTAVYGHLNIEAA